MKERPLYKLTKGAYKDKIAIAVEYGWTKTLTKKKQSVVLLIENETVEFLKEIFDQIAEKLD